MLPCTTFLAFNVQRSITEAELESVVEARSIKRRRKLDQVEIPEEHLSMTDELLGKGGFGEVYVADYNGHNAAVKVWNGLTFFLFLSGGCWVTKPTSTQVLLKPTERVEDNRNHDGIRKIFDQT